jgi:putative transposase
MAIKIQHSIRTLRLKVKTEGYSWLNKAAIEVNDVWNFANATSYKAARPFVGPSKWLSAYDLDKLTAGATKHFERIGSETIQRINAEFATRRKQSKKAKLRWRPNQAPGRALGWIPFKAAQLPVGACSRHTCSTRASRPAGASRSSARETLRENATTARPSRVLQAWTCSL